MAAPATTWPTTTASAVLAGKGAKGASVGQAFVQRLKVAQQSGVTVYFEASSTSDTREDIFSFNFRFPLWLRAGDIVRLGAHCYVSGNTGYWRLRIASTDGTEVSTVTTGTTPGDWRESEVVVPDNTWAGTAQNCIVQAYQGGTNGAWTVYVETKRVCMSFRMGD